MRENYNKIHIIGEVGSGKTYLAKKLSEKLDLPYYQLDNVVWRRTIEKDIRNTPEVRDEILNKILERDSWIIEGVHYKWVLKSFKLSDVIIYLNPNTLKRDKQIISRFLKQKLGLERGNYNQSIKNLIEMIKWNHNFEIEREPKIHEVLKPFQDKVRYFKNNKDIIKLL